MSTHRENFDSLFQYYPLNVRSTGVGLANGVGRLGDMLGPALGGILLSLNVLIVLCFLAFALPGVIAAFVLFFVRKDVQEYKADPATNIDLLSAKKLG